MQMREIKIICNLLIINYLQIKEITRKQNNLFLLIRGSLVRAQLREQIKSLIINRL